MATLASQLELDRCPHCSVDRPSLGCVASFATSTYTGERKRHWKVYVCARCGGAVTASSNKENGWVYSSHVYPNTVDVDEAIPEPAHNYLRQAIDSLHAPAGSIMLSASAIDAMLKAKSYEEGSLYARINDAVANHLITQGMAQWAHEVRLDANEQRHAGDSVSLPTSDDAQRSVEFALALGEFLFVLPSRVKQGLADATKEKDAAA